MLYPDRFKALDAQIRFDANRDGKVVEMILRNPSSPFRKRIASVQELNRLRKSMAAVEFIAPA